MSSVDSNPVDITPPTKRETGRLIFGSTVLILACVAVAYASRPYELDLPSPILVKADVHNAIDKVRKDKGYWPANEWDKNLQFSDRVHAELPFPSFKLKGVDKVKEEEIATYSFQMRGETAVHRIKFNPLSAPGRRRF